MRKPFSLLVLAAFAVSESIQNDKPILKDYPGTLDWRSRSFAVSPVKNQTDGKSPSWAFAVASAIES